MANKEHKIKKIKVLNSYFDLVSNKKQIKDNYEIIKNNGMNGKGEIK